MKLKISKEKLDALIKEEAMKLKAKRIQENEALKKISLLEGQLAEIEQEMRDVYAGQELDEELEEILGFGKSKYEKMDPAQVQQAFAKMVQKQAYGRNAAMNAERTANDIKAKYGDEAAITYMRWRLQNPASMYGVYDPESGQIRNTAIQKASGFAGDMLGAPNTGGFRIDDKK